MRRRDLLLGGAAAGALASAGPALASPEPLGVALARRIDERQARVHARIAPFSTVAPGFDGAPDQELFAGLVAAAKALTAYGTVHGLDESEVSDPGVQQRLQAACTDMARSMRQVATRLETMPGEQVQRLHGALFEDPTAAKATIDVIRSEVASMGIAPKVRKQLTNTVERVAFRMERQGTQSVLDDVLERFRRADERVSAREDRVADRATPDDDDLPLRSPHEGKNDTALGILLLGMGLTTGGMLVTGIGASSGFLLVCICVSVPMLIATILLLVAAGKVLKGADR